MFAVFLCHAVIPTRFPRPFLGQVHLLIRFCHRLWPFLWACFPLSISCHFSCVATMTCASSLFFVTPISITSAVRLFSWPYSTTAESTELRLFECQILFAKVVQRGNLRLSEFVAGNQRRSIAGNPAYHQVLGLDNLIGHSMWLATYCSSSAGRSSP